MRKIIDISSKTGTITGVHQKPSTAWGYITAHMTRIHDIDWSYRDQSQLTTCSHDSSVKFWDTASTRRPLSVIKTGSQPVWRARNYVCKTYYN